MVTKKSGGVLTVEPTSQKSFREIMKAHFKATGVDFSSHVQMGEDFKPTEFLPTGQIEVDAILIDENGVGGGIPRGTLLELAGESQSGKTYLAYKLIASAHKRGERAAFLNVENGFYEPRAIACGVDVRNEEKFVLIKDLPTAEQYCQVAEELIKSGYFAVVVIDSITALLPEDEFKKHYEDPSKIGEHARLIGRFMKRNLGPCSRTGTIGVLVNQFRMAQNSGPGLGMSRQSSGGKTIEFNTHMRLWTDRIYGAAGKVIGEGGEVIGGKSRIKVVKTRYTKPLTEAEFPILFFAAEVDPVGEFLYRLAQKRGPEPGYIQVARKEYRYVLENTGELAASKDPVEFIHQLQLMTAPEKRTRGDNSTTAFEYLTGRLKMTESQVKMLLEALKKNVAVDAPSDSAELLHTGNYGEESDDDLTEGVE